jgi:twitching motility protein PilT
MSPREEEPQLRQRLSETLRYVVSQRLVSKVDGGRILITEIMGNSLRTRETIVYGESENKTFQDIMEAGSVQGWHTFDQSFLKAFVEDQVTEETAMTYCTNKNRMRRDLDQAKKRRAAAATTAPDAPSGLKMYPPPISTRATVITPKEPASQN